MILKELLQILEDKELFVVAKIDLQYSKNAGASKTGAFTLVIPVKSSTQAEKVQGGIEAVADWVEEHSDLLHHVAQNAFNADSVISAGANVSVNVVDKAPANSAKVFYGNANDF